MTENKKDLTKINSKLTTNIKELDENKTYFLKVKYKLKTCV